MSKSPTSKSSVLLIQAIFKQKLFTAIKNEACINPEPSKSPPETFDEPKTATFQCSICPNKFNTKDELTVHIKNHFKHYRCTVCGEVLVGDTSYEYHKSTHESSDAAGHSVLLVRSCKVCKKQFPDSVVLREHMKLEHKPDEDFMICELCLDTFTSKGLLNRHVREKHFHHNEEAVSCDICGRVCPNLEAVTAHRRTHEVDKDFQCDYCGKGFSRKKNLEFHIRSHTGNRPFQCKVCPKTFATISGLNCHVRTHTKERPFKCPYCEKCYIHSTDLRRHRRSHGGEEKRFQCDMCDMKFFERKYLKVHEKKHRSQIINLEMVMIKEVEECADNESADMEEEYVL